MKGLALLLLPVLGMACASPQRSTAECAGAFPGRQFLEAANRLRARDDLDPLATDSALNEQAGRWADYNASQDKRTHYDAEGRGPLERLKAAGLMRSSVAENIAAAPPSLNAESIFRAWQNKPEGENVLHPLYRRAGYAVSSKNGTCVIVLILTE